MGMLAGTEQTTSHQGLGDTAWNLVYMVKSIPTWQVRGSHLRTPADGRRSTKHYGVAIPKTMNSPTLDTTRQ